MERATLLPMPELGCASVPAFRNGDDAARVAHSALRRRLLDGGWADDATTRHRQFFSDATHDFLPPPELSHNAFLLFVDAKSTLYDEAVKVEAKGATDLTVVVTPELWPLAQENLRLVNGLNESYMRVDVADGRISYRVVPADCVGDVESLPSRPDRPVALTEIRPRSRRDGEGKMITEYTLETWDVRDPAKPVFKIELDVEDPLKPGTSTRVDVTHLYYLDAEGKPITGYPYRGKPGAVVDGVATPGAPIFPYIAYHAKVGNTLWNAWAGMEVVEGTLNASALWTFWMMGVRDGAHPQRYTIDLEVDGMTLASKQGQPATGYVEMIPTAVLRFKSKGDGRGSAGQFEPAMQPKEMGESITDYEAGLARFAGIDAPDVQRSGASGYALVVSADGKRKAQKRLEAPCRMGDTLLLATAARLANAYLAASLPEDEKDWTVTYAKGRRSIEEIKAGYEEAKALQEIGAWDEVDAVLHVYPEFSREQALAKVLDVIETRRIVAEARRAASPAPVVAPPPPTPEPSEEASAEAAA